MPVCSHLMRLRLTRRPYQNCSAPFTVAAQISELPGLDSSVIPFSTHAVDYTEVLQAIVKLRRNIIVIINNNATQIDSFLLQGWKFNLFTAGRAFIIISSESHLISYSPIGMIILAFNEATIGDIANFESYLSGMFDDAPVAVTGRRDVLQYSMASTSMITTSFSTHDAPQLRTGEGIQVDATPSPNFISPLDARYPLFRLISGDGYLQPGSMTLFDAIHMYGLALNGLLNAAAGSVPSRMQIGTAMESMSYEGWTGVMSFDASTGFRQHGHALVLSAGANSTYSALMSLDNTESNFTVIQPVPIWPGNTSRIPDDQIINLPIAVVMTVDSYPLPFNTTLRQFFSYAAAYINNVNYQYLPPRTQISLLIFPNSSASDIILSAVPLVNYGVIGVLGAVSSTSSMLVQNVVSKYGIPQISPAATSPALSTKSTYPTFLRTVTSDDFQGEAMIRLAKKNHWTEISIFCSTDTYGQGLTNAVTRQAVANGIKILSRADVSTTSESRLAEHRAAVQTLKKAGTRVLFILHATPRLAVSAMEAAEWTPLAVVGSDSMGVGDVFGGNTNHTNFISGWVCFTPSGGNGDAYDLFVNRTLNGTIPRLNPAGVQANVATGNFILTTIMDALFAYASAIKIVRNNNGDLRNSTAMLEALYATNTPSLGGHNISFNQSTGDRLEATYDILNFLNGTTTTAARLTTAGIWTNLRTITWPDGTTSIPTSPLPRELDWLKWQSGVGIVLGTLAALGLVLCLLCSIFLIWQRKSPVVYASNWPFLLTIIIGAAFGYSSVFPYIGRPHPWICAFRVWLQPLSYAFAGVPLVMKTWRLYHFWRQKDLKVVPMANWKLVIISTILIMVQFVICIFWQSLGTIDVIIKDDTTTTTRAYVLCDLTSYNRAGAISTMIYEGILLIIGGYLAFKVRKLPRNFNESRWIGFALYNTLFFSLVIVILTFSLRPFPVLVNIFICCTTLVIPTGLLLFMFAPKMWDLARHPERRVERSPKMNRKSGSMQSNGDVRDQSSMGSSIFLHTPGASMRSHRSKIHSIGTTADLTSNTDERFFVGPHSVNDSVLYSLPPYEKGTRPTVPPPKKKKQPAPVMSQTHLYELKPIPDSYRSKDADSKHSEGSTKTKKKTDKKPAPAPHRGENGEKSKKPTPKHPTIAPHKAEKKEDHQSKSAMAKSSASEHSPPLLASIEQHSEDDSSTTSSSSTPST